MKEKRLDLYWIRILACLMVVVTHLTANPMVEGAFPHAFYKVLNAATKWCVPLFIFLSGFLLERNYAEEISYSHYFAKTFKRLILPYVLWLSVYYGIFVATGVYPLSFKQFAIGLLTGNIVFHLYYMVISIQLYLLYPLIRKAKKRVGFLPLFLLAVPGALYSGWIPGLRSYAYLLFSAYLLYALLGMFLAENDSKLRITRRSMWVGVVLCVLAAGLFYLSYTEAFLIPTPQYVIASVLGVCGIYWLARGLGDLGRSLSRTSIRWVQRVSDATDVVYFAHVLVMMFAAKVSPFPSRFVLFASQLLGIFVLWAVTAWGKPNIRLARK